MKYLLALICASTPIFAQEPESNCRMLPIDQSADISFFHSEHKEKGYSYDLNGFSLSYEIGNPTGVEAQGKVWISKQKDLILIKSRDLLRYNFPFYSLYVAPFLGAQHFNHKVHNEDDFDVRVVKSHTIFGVSVKGEYADVEYGAHFAHAHNILNTILKNENDNFWGHKDPVDHQYFTGLSIGYPIADTSKIIICGDYEKSYKHKNWTWTIEADLKYTF